MVCPIQRYLLQVLTLIPIIPIIGVFCSWNHTIFWMMCICQKEEMSMYLFKNVSKLMVMSLAIAFALVSLSGAVVAGDEGCVTCHAGPMALNTMLTQNIENHPDIGPMVNTVPTDCAMCHAKDSPTALMEVVHSRHEGVACDNCHVVDADTDVPTSVKTGAKNW
jgi:hypothetical protein